MNYRKTLMSNQSTNPLDRAAIFSQVADILGRPFSPAEEQTLPLAARAGGTRLFGPEGRSLHDLSSAGGALLLGFAHPMVRQALAAVLEEGVPQSIWPIRGVQVAARLQQLFGAPERVMLTGGAKESRELAVRAARLATGREEVVLVGLEVPVSGNCRRVSSAAVGDMDLTGVAAVLVDPLCAETLKVIQKKAALARVPLIVDESLTAFRLARVAVHLSAGVPVDLVCLGESIAGGLGCGALLGRAEYFSHLAGTPPCTGDPFALAAANAVIEYVEANPVAAELARIGEVIRAAFAKSCAREGMEMTLSGPPARMRFQLVDQDNATAEQIGHYFTHELCRMGGFSLWELFPNLAMKGPDLDEICEVLDRGVGRIRTLLIQHNSYISPGIPFVFPTALAALRDRGLSRYRFPKLAAVDIEPQGAAVRVTVAPGDWGPVVSSGFFAPTAIRGDLAVSVRYRVLGWSPGPGGATMGLLLHDVPSTRRHYVKRTATGDPLQHYALAQFHDQATGQIPLAGDEGDLKMTRVADKLQAWHREIGPEGPGEWQSLGVAAQSFGDDIIVCAKIWTEGPSAGLSVEFSDLVISGEVSPEQVPLAAPIPDPRQEKN